MPRKRKSRLTLGRTYLKEKKTKPTQADLTEDLQIFDAAFDDNSYFTLIVYIICVCQRFYLWKDIRKKEEIWLSPITKAPTPTEMSKGQSDNTNNATKKVRLHFILFNVILWISNFNL